MWLHVTGCATSRPQHDPFPEKEHDELLPPNEKKADTLPLHKLQQTSREVGIWIDRQINNGHRSTDRFIRTSKFTVY